ncbi:GNAT family N-acetyltransferase [Nostoc sp. PA-18-2419]|uniref:GNAT family N-acetyltransferase n=1 Tax=Nostoc sp. PA-18-2419 TaxID=2575443 RepID=UPI0011096421|nr:GNAT family N-acetyltransferase [Nostoc sp. PA-18-2419]
MINKVTESEHIKIRQANIKDAERIANLCEQIEYYVTNQQIEQRLAKIEDNNAHIVYAATLANQYVIGWAHAYISDLLIIPTQAILLGLVVDKNYRRIGIGRILMQQIEQWAYLTGCEGVILRSSLRRKEAHLFYEKVGYTNIKQSLAFQKQLVS